MTAEVSGACTCAKRHPSLVVQGRHCPSYLTLKNGKHAVDCPKSMKRRKRQKARRAKVDDASV